MQPDVIIIGSGVGGASYAAALAPSGRNVLILERGERLQPSPFDRDGKAIFADQYFMSDEIWHEPDDTPFQPGNYAFVGGNSKMYGAALIRFRPQDFRAREHLGGSTPSWPLSYEELEPFYSAAEDLYQVCGDRHPHSPVPHEPDMIWLKDRLTAAGLSPEHLPLGIDLNTWLAGGQSPWDGHPGTGFGKMDAETCALAEALKHPNVILKTGCTAERLVAGPDGRIAKLHVETSQGAETLTAPVIILAAGAVQSVALLLGSAAEAYPTGLANRSDQVGRNFMNHNASAMMAVMPWRQNRSIYQKTLMVNDYYDQGPEGKGPLGNIQMLGKISGPILKAQVPWLPQSLAGWIARRSFDFYAMSEDLPDPRSRVTLANDKIVLN